MKPFPLVLLVPLQSGALRLPVSAAEPGPAPANSNPAPHPVELWPKAPCGRTGTVGAEYP